MIRDKSYLVALIVAVFAGIVAVFGVSLWFKAYESSKITKMVVASQNISAGDVLTTQNLKLEEWIGPDIPIGTMIEITPLLNRISKNNILNGDILKESSLVQLIADGSLASAISLGKRAFSIRVTEEEGVAGFILPGNYVDILFSTKDRNGHGSSKLLLEKILVLAIAQERTKPNRIDPKVVNVVTLEINPKQADKLNLARTAGNLSLVLRNQLDKTEFGELEINSEVPPSKVKNELRNTKFHSSIEIIRGTTRQNAYGIR